MLHMADDGLGYTLLLACRTGGRDIGAALFSPTRHHALRAARCRPRHPHHLCASRQHRATAARRRAQDRARVSAQRILRDDERRAWLRLARTETIGPTTFAALIARFGDAREALDAAPRLARHGGAKELRMPSESDARAEIDALARLGGRLLASVE